MPPVLTPGSIADLGGGGGVTDHGALTGLADDDHLQYHNNARGDARYDATGAAAAAQAAAVQRANHTGTQLATTVSDFDSAVRAAAVAQTITNGVTTSAPSQDAIFDALAGYQPLDADLTLLAHQATTRRTSDSTAVNNSVVLVDDSQIVPAVEANTTYMVTGVMIVASNATADWRYRLSGPAGASGSFVHAGNGSVIALGADSGSVSTATTTLITIDGYLTTAGTAGSLTLAWAQGTATAVDTKLLTGSWLRLVPIA